MSPPNRTQPAKKIGLALGSGGWRGLAHIGVIKSLVKHGYEISAIAGSSAGSLIGGMYALWQDIEKVEWIFTNLKYKDLLFAFRDPSTKLGFFSNRKTIALLEKYMGKATFDDVQIPFAAVGTDIISGERQIFTKGALAKAIQASSNVPLVFDPAAVEGKLIVDGGISNPVPVDIVKTLGATLVIAVNLYQSVFPVEKKAKNLSRVDVVMLSYELMLNQLAKRDALSADIIVEPRFENAQSDPFLHFINNKQAIDNGEDAMKEQITKLSQL